MGFTFPRNVHFDEKDILSQVSSSATGVFGLFCGHECMYVGKGMIREAALRIRQGEEPGLSRCFEEKGLNPQVLGLIEIRDWNEQEQKYQEAKGSLNPHCA